MKTVEVSESALESLKAMVVQLQSERDELLKVLKPFASFAKHYPKEGGRFNRATSGPLYSVASGDLGKDTINVEDFHNVNLAIAKCTQTQSICDWQEKMNG